MCAFAGRLEVFRSRSPRAAGIETIFFQLTMHGVTRLFAFFYFSARKFPFHRHGLMTRSLADEELSIFHDQCGHNSLHAGLATSVEIEFGPFSMQLVKVKAKAASPAGQISSSICSPKS